MGWGRVRFFRFFGDQIKIFMNPLGIFWKLTIPDTVINNNVYGSDNLQQQDCLNMPNTNWIQ